MVFCFTEVSVFNRNSKSMKRLDLSPVDVDTASY